MTTLPPLSPVASNSPSWLNSTHEMMSAGEMNKNNTRMRGRKSRSIQYSIYTFFPREHYISNKNCFGDLVERVGEDSCEAA